VNAGGLVLIAFAVLMSVPPVGARQGTQEKQSDREPRVRSGGCIFDGTFLTEMHMRLRIPATMAAFVALTIAAQAQTPTPPPANTSPSNRPAATSNSSAKANVSSADRNFATKAAAAGLAEVNDARLALKNASRQDVKDFAQRMVQDHSKANDQLKSIASSDGITLPTSESAADQKKSDALQKLTGAKFERQYIEGQRAAHKQAVSLFSAESKSGKDSQLKSFASQTLPTLQDHLKMISGMPLTQKTSSNAR
jgi:putative membrane protein